MPTKGSLEVICGPMFSGKSEELIRRLRRAKIAQQSIAVFKPSIDTRYQTDAVVSHNGMSITALPIENSHEILTEIQKNNPRVVGIDEIQFFSSEIINIICTLIENGIRVIIAGLNCDFRGVPFGSMPTLLAIADQVTKLHAICTQCGNDAPLTQRLVNNKPARFDDPIILVGAQESYQAACRNCFIIQK